MFTENINGINLTLETESSVFSPNKVDIGTLSMLSKVTLSHTDKLLDLGCGCGIIGIWAAKQIGVKNVVMSDISETCISLAEAYACINGVPGIKTVQSDGFKNIDDVGFTWILSNPPYHVDFSVPKHFIEKGFNRLEIGGKMVMVTKRKEWYKNKLTSIFGGVTVFEEGGYFIFKAEKRSAKYSK